MPPYIPTSQLVRVSFLQFCVRLTINKNFTIHHMQKVYIYFPQQKLYPSRTQQAYLRVLSQSLIWSFYFSWNVCLHSDWSCIKSYVFNFFCIYMLLSVIQLNFYDRMNSSSQFLIYFCYVFFSFSSFIMMYYKFYYRSFFAFTSHFRHH